jgi:hypothetical protein
LVIFDQFNLHSCPSFKLLFSQKRCVLNFTKYGLGDILSDFSLKTSGHTVEPIKNFFGREAFAAALCSLFQSEFKQK